jgi:hypothetical protein
LNANPSFDLAATEAEANLVLARGDGHAAQRSASNEHVLNVDAVFVTGIDLE